MWRGSSHFVRQRGKHCSNPRDLDLPFWFPDNRHSDTSRVSWDKSPRHLPRLSVGSHCQTWLQHLPCWWDEERWTCARVSYCLDSGSTQRQSRSTHKRGCLPHPRFQIQHSYQLVWSRLWYDAKSYQAPKLPSALCCVCVQSPWALQG